MTATLAARWQGLWTGLGLPAPAGLLDALLDAYGEPQRHYHTLQHLGECFALFDTVRQLVDHPLEVELALWFHDSVYDVHAHDNEARSSDWADRALRAAGLPIDACARIHALIMATCHDALPDSNDARLLTDIDLAILGAGPERFDEYERQIRLEYGYVAQAVFERERAKVLQRFLDRPQLYATPQLRGLLESRARDNLSRAMHRSGFR